MSKNSNKETYPTDTAFFDGIFSAIQWELVFLVIQKMTVIIILKYKKLLELILIKKSC